MNPWKNKEENKAKALARYHMLESNPISRAMIDQAVANTIVYDLKMNDDIYITDQYIDRLLAPGESFPKVEYLNMTTQEAILYSMSTLKEYGKACVLNFASYKNPGGKFLDGSMAQEESLCHSSNLYNILLHFDKYYEWNNKNLNKALYTDRALYTQGVTFDKVVANCPMSFNVDVLTIAAPNASAYFRYNNNVEEFETALRKRMSFMKEIVIDQQVDIFVAGAFGCGVFGNDPSMVATLFRDIWFGDSRLAGMHLLFAVPGNDVNAEVFSHIL